MGALMTSPEGIAEWVAEFRSQSNGPFQLNRWIPQPIPSRNPAAEKRIRDFLSKWGLRFRPKLAMSGSLISNSNAKLFLPPSPALSRRLWASFQKGLLAD